MKRFLFYSLVVLTVLGQSCEEQGPAIRFDADPVSLVDTHYLGPPVQASSRNVLVEEFTGATCANCPAARDMLTSISDQNPGRIIPIEIHIFNFQQSKPAHGARYDLRTEAGTAIGQQIYSAVSGMPSAGFNRLPFQGELLHYTPKWAGAIDEALKAPGILNLDLSSQFDPSSRVATIHVRVTYAQAVNEKQYLSLALLEDDLIDIQEFTHGKFDSAYAFKHTLRDFLTPVTGIEFLADLDNKEPGRVYERWFTYEVPEDFQVKNCQLVAFVHRHDAQSKEVLQVTKAPLAP